MRRLTLVLLTLLLAFPLAASAARMGSGETYVLSGGELLSENLYAAGGTVQLNGAVDGDAMIAGGNLTAGNKVSKDLLAVGGTIMMIGDVGEDARLAGGNVLLAGEVGGELVAVGGMVTTTPDCRVRGDAIVMGGQLLLNGEYAGDMEVRGEEVTISGRVDGNVSGEMSSLTVTDGAVINGNLIYKSPGKAAIGEGAVINGEIIFEQGAVGKGVPEDAASRLDGAEKSIKSALAAFAVFRYLATLAAAFVLVLWFSKRSQVLVEASLKGFGHNVLVGLGVAIVFPIAAILLLLTGIGASLAVVGGAAFVLLMAVSGIFAGVVLGVYVRRSWTKTKKAAADWKSVLLGVTLLNVVCVIPVIGPLFKLVLVLGVLGAMSGVLYDYLKPKGK